MVDPRAESTSSQPAFRAAAQRGRAKLSVEDVHRNPLVAKVL